MVRAVEPGTPSPKFQTKRSTKVEAKAERDLSRATAVLAEKNDPDSVAAPGLLSFSHHRDDSLSLIARATEAAPERADLVWLRAQVCQESTACDPEPVERHLRELDPSNGAGWMGALARASSSKNHEAKNVALAAIGHSDRVDIYWTTLIARLGRATVQTKTISPWQAEVTIIGVLAAVAIPAYSAASNGCKGELLKRAETVEVCRGVAQAFQHVFLAQLIAAGKNPNPPSE
jgi:hypothetical protein